MRDQHEETDGLHAEAKLRVSRKTIAFLVAICTSGSLGYGARQWVDSRADAGTITSATYEQKRQQCAALADLLFDYEVYFTEIAALPACQSVAIQTGLIERRAQSDWFLNGAIGFE